jgi:2-dehydropantoate 2-reductase
MGSIYAGMLAACGVEVWLIGRSAQHAAVIEADGLRLGHDGAERVTRPRATTDPGAAGEVDLLMVWVKSQDTDDALRAAAPMIGTRTLLATFQNGVGNVEKLAAVVGRERVVYGVSTVGGVLDAPGRVELTAATWNGTATTWMGVLEGDAEARLAPLFALLTRAGMRAEVRRDVDVIVWSKLAMSIPMNTLGALTRRNIGAVMDDPGLAEVHRQMTEEIVAVARAQGVPLDLEEAVRHYVDTYASAGSHLPSMLQDVLGGRPTEVDALAGALVREAERLGLEAPVTSVVGRLAAALRPT